MAIAHNAAQHRDIQDLREQTRRLSDSLECSRADIAVLKESVDTLTTLLSRTLDNSDSALAAPGRPGWVHDHTLPYMPVVDASSPSHMQCALSPQLSAGASTIALSGTENVTILRHTTHGVDENDFMPGSWRWS